MILYKHTHEDTYRYIENFYYKNNGINVSSIIQYKDSIDLITVKEHYDFGLTVGIKLLIIKWI
jgi:hypothetical protein